MTEPVRATVRIDAARVLGPVSPWLYGHFSEHLHRVIQGGVWAELLVNRTFEMPGLPGRVPEVAQGWEPSGGHWTGATGWALPLCRDSHHAQVVGLPEDGAESGIQQAGVPLDAGCTYRAHVACSAVGAVEALRFELRDAAGASVAAAVVDVPTAARVDQPFGTPDFRVLLHEGAVVSVELTSPVTDPDGRFCVSATASGRAELWLHSASLMPDDALDGLHAGIVELFRELPANLVKYPGGCFADGYDWRAGVGPRETRFAAANQAWGIWEENDFGTDEFLRWCELTRTTPYLCVNHGTGSPELAAAWVEYCNGDPATRWGAERARNGHPEPYGVGLWAIGNEVYGAWERGHADAATYAARVGEFAAAMRTADPSIRIAAQGDLGAYSREVLERCGAVIDYLSVHHYSRLHDLDAVYDAAGHLAEGRAFEGVLKNVADAIQSTDGAQHVRLALDEWGWASERQGLAGAAFTACVLNACARLAPYVQIGAHCCLVNPGSVVERLGQQLTLNLQHDVYHLFNRTARGQAVASESDCAALDVSAYADERGAAAVVVNAGEERVSVRIDGLGAAGALEAVRIGASGTSAEPAGAGAVEIGRHEIVALAPTRI